MKRSWSTVAAIVLLAGSHVFAGTTLSDPWGDPTATPNVYTTTGAGIGNVGALQLNTADGVFGCSATLIADGSWILTAGHCSDGATAGGTIFSLDAQVGTNGFFRGFDTHNVTEIVPHPKWDGSLSRGYDIALMRLSTAVPGVTPASLYTGSDERGQDVTITGYGMYGTDLAGAIGTDGFRRAGTNVVDNFWRTGGKTSRLLAIDFDNGSASAFGSATPTATELFSVFGDSGGPVFIGNEVAGVNSFLGDANGDGLYGNAGDYSGHTRVSEFVDWISSVTSTVPGGGGGGDETDGGGGPPPNRGGGRFTAVRPIALTAVAPVPEPGSLALGLCLGAFLGWFQRRGR